MSEEKVWSIDSILTEWEKDCIIDKKNLDNSAIESSKLHAKYLRILIESKINKSKAADNVSVIRNIRTRYYNGKLTKPELDKYNWEQYQGIKPLKTELQDMLEADEYCIKYKKRLDYYEIMVTELEMILKQIQQRDWEIKTALDWKKFQSGAI